MNLTALHRRLLQDVLEIGNAFPFVITGGYAVQAHGLVDRLSRDIDVATNSSVPMASLADDLIAGLTERDEFSLEGLAIRLGSVQWRDDDEFSAYGLSGDEIAELRNWAQGWSDDINRRLYAETYVDDGDDGIP
jgi:hypothetical protein